MPRGSLHRRHSIASSTGELGSMDEDGTEHYDYNYKRDQTVKQDLAIKKIERAVFEGHSLSSLNDEDTMADPGTPFHRHRQLRRTPAMDDLSLCPPPLFSPPSMTVETFASLAAEGVNNASKKPLHVFVSNSNTANTAANTHIDLLANSHVKTTTHGADEIEMTPLKQRKNRTADDSGDAVINIPDTSRNDAEAPTLQTDKSNFQKGLIFLRDEAGKRIFRWYSSAKQNAHLVPALNAVVDKYPQYDPINWPAWQRWTILTIYCLVNILVLSSTTLYQAAMGNPDGSTPGSLFAKYHDLDEQTMALGESLFIVGNAFGPAFLAPLADINGRKWVYVASLFLWSCFCMGCLCSTTGPMLVSFMALSGFLGSACLANIAGTIFDTFGNVHGSAYALAFFVLSSNVGPSVGSPLGQYITQRWGANWIFINMMVAGFALAVICCVVPETRPRFAIAQNCDPEDVPVEDRRVLTQDMVGTGAEIWGLTTLVLRLMVSQPILWVLGLLNGYCFGILYLYLAGVYDVYHVNKGFSILNADLTYLNLIAGGIVMMFILVPIQQWWYKRVRDDDKDVAPPRARFYLAGMTVAFIPVAMGMFSWASGPGSPKGAIFPIICGGIMGVFDPFLWLAMLIYVLEKYPLMPASAVAAFMIPSNVIAAGLLHAGLYMFEHHSPEYGFRMIAYLAAGMAVGTWAFIAAIPKLEKWSSATGVIPDQNQVMDHQRQCKQALVDRAYDQATKSQRDYAPLFIGDGIMPTEIREQHSRDLEQARSSRISSQDHAHTRSSVVSQRPPAAHSAIPSNSLLNKAFPQLPETHSQEYIAGAHQNLARFHYPARSDSPQSDAAFLDNAHVALRNRPASSLYSASPDRNGGSGFRVLVPAQSPVTMQTAPQTSLSPPSHPVKRAEGTVPASYADHIDREANRARQLNINTQPNSKTNTNTTTTTNKPKSKVQSAIAAFEQHHLPSSTSTSTSDLPKRTASPEPEPARHQRAISVASFPRPMERAEELTVVKDLPCTPREGGEAEE